MNVSLPFGFANKNKVLLNNTEDGVCLHYTEDTPVSALLEMQRQLATSDIALQKNRFCCI